MKNNIEIEIRSFISKKEYTKLLSFFKENSVLIKEDKQETIYFDCKQDLRIQKNNFTSKIWLKEGKLHEDSRKEIEIHTEKGNFNKLKDLFKTLGYKEEIIWLRNRKEFKWKGIKICLDYTIGYGYILELEKISSRRNKDKILTSLRTKLKELKIIETPKEIFDKKYENYKKNWKKLIKGTSF